MLSDISSWFVDDDDDDDDQRLLEFVIGVDDDGFDLDDDKTVMTVSRGRSGSRLAERKEGEEKEKPTQPPLSSRFGHRSHNQGQLLKTPQTTTVKLKLAIAFEQLPVAINESEYSKCNHIIQATI
ncbi:hypothetical protein RIF29_40869 [Crotalaria pallida]|uniref:Uncharacterized protein n=1 Tax=Crotalaria pallida TaxID=3830 RepID=A0AAN9E6A1_CROPI